MYLIQKTYLVCTPIPHTTKDCPCDGPQPGVVPGRGVTEYIPGIFTGVATGPVSVVQGVVRDSSVVFVDKVVKATDFNKAYDTEDHGTHNHDDDGQGIRVDHCT